MGLFSLKKRMLWEDLIVAFWYLTRAYKKERKRLFTRACTDRTRGNVFSLQRLGLDWKKFLMTRVVRHWHRLFRTVVDNLSLEALKVSLDGASSNLI